MFELWRLKWRRWRLEQRCRKSHDALVKAKASRELIAQDDNECYWALQEMETELDQEVGHRLYMEARSLDVETPLPKDSMMWMTEEASGRIWFSPKGRAHVRKLIDEEKARRFEVRTRWVMRIILPLIVALVGLIGALTGLIAVLARGK